MTTSASMSLSESLSAKAQLLPKRQHKPIRSAGIMFYTVFKGTLLFLLGKEAYEPGWNDSDRWSDFGGRMEGSETIEEGACREAYEETAGCVALLPELQQRVAKQDYAFYTDVHMSKSSYRCYVMRVPYRNYNSLFRYVKHFVQYTKGNAKIIEKSQLRWFSLEHIESILGDKWYTYGKRPRFRGKFCETMRTILRTQDMNKLSRSKPPLLTPAVRRFRAVRPPPGFDSDKDGEE